MAKGKYKPFTGEQLRGFMSGKYPGLVKRLAGELADAHAKIRSIKEPPELAKLRGENARLRKEAVRLLEEINRDAITPLPLPGDRDTGNGECPKCRGRFISKVGAVHLCHKCGKVWEHEAKPTQAEEQRAGPDGTQTPVGAARFPF